MNSHTLSCYFWEHGCNIDWPAWVQAVGSVLAIFAAIIIAAWQHSENRRIALEDRDAINKHTLQICYDLIENTYEFIKTICSYRSSLDQKESFYQRQDYRKYVRRLSETFGIIPIANLPTANAFKQMQKFKRWLDAIEDEVSKLQGSPGDAAEMQCNELYAKSSLIILAKINEAMVEIKAELDKY